MINFRFHLVSLIAVFLAIGIGIAMGASFMDVATVDAIRGQLDRLEDNYRERGTEIDAWKSQTKELDSALDTMFLDDSLLLSGRLEDRRIVLISATDAPARTLDAVWAVLGSADGQRAAEIRIGDGSNLSDRDVLSALRELIPNLAASASADALPIVMEQLGSALAVLSYEANEIVPSTPVPPDGSSDDQSEPEEPAQGEGTGEGDAAGASVGDHPASGGDTAEATEPRDPASSVAPTTEDTTTSTITAGDVESLTDTVPTEEDLAHARELIEGLVALRVISLDTHGSDPAALFPEVPGVSYVMVGASTPGGSTFRSLRSVATGIAKGAPAVLTVADGGEPRQVGRLEPRDDGVLVSLVDGLREDPVLPERLSTVDGIEELTARVTIVLALEEQARGATGQYGRRSGAKALFPVAAPR